LRKEDRSLFQITYKDNDGATEKATLDLTPDFCPVCGKGIEPIDPHWAAAIGDYAIERVLACPRHSCQSLFIARYRKNRYSGYYFLGQCVPTEPKGYSAPQELEQISPDFCAIYSEAQKAEQLGLALICGPGYRKALEFLMKDYLSAQQTTAEAKATIARSPLMNCISNFVTDSRIKTTAERATWLGNDETHYVRKWEDKDLQDLKKFIQLTVYWIQSEHLTNTALAEMPAGKE
jgi:hypothetical protein